MMYILLFIIFIIIYLLFRPLLLTAQIAMPCNYTTLI